MTSIPSEANTPSKLVVSLDRDLDQAGKHEVEVVRGIALTPQAICLPARRSG